MKNKILFRILFSCYLLLFVLTFISSSGVTNVGGLPYFQKMIRCSNLIPFKDIAPFKIMFSIFLMYMPLGLLARESFMIFKNNKLLYTFIIIFIALHEVIQVITLKGYFDINAIIVGSFGAISVCIIIDFFNKYLPRQSIVKR